MLLLPLAWTLWTTSLWTSGSGQVLQRDAIKVLYPELLSTETIDCDCSDAFCDTVYWFHTSPVHHEVQYLGKCNNANRNVYASTKRKARLKFSKKSGASFTLRISNVSEDDAGVFSCVLKGRRNTEIWKPGVLLRPGVAPPTLPPVTKLKPPVKSVCRCPKNSSQDGCGPLVLWPLVGFVAALALALVSTLYYFSRLPRKCRHHFVKGR